MVWIVLLGTSGVLFARVYGGYETSPLTTGVSFLATNDTVALGASLQYPVVPTVVLGVLGNDWLPPVFVWSMKVQAHVPLGTFEGLCMGPSVVMVSKAFERIVVTSYGLDFAVVFHDDEGPAFWTIGVHMPLVLHGEMVNSSPNGIAWAWDEFGFALIPSVQLMWKL